MGQTQEGHIGIYLVSKEVRVNPKKRIFYIRHQSLFDVPTITAVVLSTNFTFRASDQSR